MRKNSLLGRDAFLVVSSLVEPLAMHGTSGLAPSRKRKRAST